MNVTLRPNRNLLDPNFESYKLNLTKIPIYNAAVFNGITQHKIPENVYSKLQIKAFFDYNCLINDPFKPGSIYYISSTGSVILVMVPERPQAFNAGHMVFNIPNCEDCRKFDDTSVSIQFPAIDTYALYDGKGSLYICCAEFDDCGLMRWRLLSTINPPLDNKSARLLDCLLVSSDEQNAATKLDCLFVSVGENFNSSQTESIQSDHVTYVDWISYEQTANSTWNLSTHNHLKSKSYPDFVTFEKGASGVHICSDKPFVFISNTPDECESADSDKHLKTDLGSPQTSEVSINDPTTPSSIRWSQTPPDSTYEFGSLTISFPLSPDLAASKFHCDSVKPTLQTVRLADKDEIGGDESIPAFGQQLHVQLNPNFQATTKSNGDQSDSLILMNQMLFGLVKHFDITWSVDRENNCLDIHLAKQHLLHWPRLLQNPVVDRELCVECNIARLPNVESDTNLDEIPTSRPTFNIGQLEDVDFPMDEEDDFVVQRFGQDPIQCTHKVNLSGHQWLLKLQCQRCEHSGWTSTHAFCVRYDVDGIVWLPCPNESSPNATQWKHVSTLQAFGYVLASKRDHRFVVCPPLDGEEPVPFVAVADTSKRIYIYRQPMANQGFPNGDTELRRRYTKSSDSSGVVHVAWQYVISLPTDDPIMGFVVMNKPYPACVVCTGSSLYLLSLAG